MKRLKIRPTTIRSKSEPIARLVLAIMTKGKKIKSAEKKKMESKLFDDYFNQKKNSIKKRNALERWKKYVKENV